MSCTDELGVMVIDLNLSAQAGDSEINRSRADVGVEVSPDGAKQLVAADDDVAVLGEIAQQLELSMGER